VSSEFKPHHSEVNLLITDTMGELEVRTMPHMLKLCKLKDFLSLNKELQRGNKAFERIQVGPFQGERLKFVIHLMNEQHMSDLKIVFNISILLTKELVEEIAIHKKNRKNNDKPLTFRGYVVRY